MLSPFEIRARVAAVGSGRVAGLCFAIASFLLRPLDRLGASQAIRAPRRVRAAFPG